MKVKPSYKVAKAFSKALVTVIALFALCLLAAVLFFEYSAKPQRAPQAASISEIGTTFAGLPLSGIPSQTTSFSSKTFVHPPSQFRPWIRWWWPGDAVDPNEIDSELYDFEKADFGGVEIQSFARGLDATANPAYFGFDTPSFYRHLVDAMNAAKRHNLQVDLTVGSGYPTAVPSIAVEDSLLTLMYGTFQIHGSRLVQRHIPKPSPAFWYKGLSTAGAWTGKTLIDFYPSSAKPLATVAYRVTAQRFKADLLAIGRQPDLDYASAVDLSSAIDAQGIIHWVSPAGDWLVITFYAGPSGTRPFPEPALKDPGHVVDFFASTKTRALNNHFFGPRTGLPAYFGFPMRGIFADSFELQIERHVVADILQQFRSRRGYDLTPHLAAIPVPGADNWYLNIAGVKRHPAFLLNTQDEKIRHDYDLTISDLFIERYIKTNSEWALRHGLRFRVQPYGLNIDIIAAAAASDIPETEVLYGGGAEMFLKLVSSGAHLGGRNLISAEAFDHPGAGDQMSSTAMRAEADRLFAAGVNQIVFHGFPYNVSSVGHRSVNWYPFAAKSQTYSVSSNFAKTIHSSELKSLNEYLARAQYLLRLGKPRADVLLYYPFLGFPNDYSVLSLHKEFGFNGLLPNLQSPSVKSPVPRSLAPLFVSPDKDEIAWLDRTWTIIADLERHGISWDWVDDKAIQNARINQRKTIIADQEYSSVLFIDTPSLPLETAQAVRRLSSAGGRIHFIGSVPQSQTGTKEPQLGDKAVQQQILETISEQGYGEEASITDASREASALQDVELNTSSEAVRRADRTLAQCSTLTLLSNQGDQPATIRLTVHSGSWWWLNASDGTIQSASQTQSQLSATLAPYSTIFLLHRGARQK